MEAIKTENRRKKEERDRNICVEYVRLMGISGSMKTAVINKLMQEFGVSYALVYRALAAERRKKDAENQAVGGRSFKNS